MRLNEIEDTNVYYHGTNNYPFDKFDNKYTGGIGFHFTKKLEQARSHGKTVIVANLDLGNIAPVQDWSNALNKASGGNPRRMAINTLKEMGYNSVQTSYETIVFDPEQIHVVGIL